MFVPGIEPGPFSHVLFLLSLVLLEFLALPPVYGWIFVLSVVSESKSGEFPVPWAHLRVFHSGKSLLLI